MFNIIQKNNKDTFTYFQTYKKAILYLNKYIADYNWEHDDNVLKLSDFEIKEI